MIFLMKKLWFELLSSLVESVRSTADFVSLHGDPVSLPFDFVNLLVKFQLSESIMLIL